MPSGLKTYFTKTTAASMACYRQVLVLQICKEEILNSVHTFTLHNSLAIALHADAQFGRMVLWSNPPDSMHALWYQHRGPACKMPWSVLVAGKIPLGPSLSLSGRGLWTGDCSTSCPPCIWKSRRSQSTWLHLKDSELSLRLLWVHLAISAIASLTDQSSVFSHCIVKRFLKSIFIHQSGNQS